MKTDITIKTKMIHSHFTGEIRKCYFPLHGDRWIVTCTTYSGGGDPILDVIDFKSLTYQGLVSKLKDFAADNNLVMILK